MSELSTENRASSLPDRWIGKIFDEMQAMYGSKFTDMWKGIEPLAIRSTWAMTLAGFTARPECLKAALCACDERPWPPTLPEFLGLCRDAAKRVGSQHLALPAPEIDLEASGLRAKELAGAVKKTDAYDWLGWAKKLRTRYLGGERLLPVQIDMASEALGESWSLNSVEITERLAA